MPHEHEMEASCENCKWAIEVTWDKGSFYQCWALPPVMYSSGRGTKFAKFPSVNANCGCSKFDPSEFREGPSCDNCDNSGHRAEYLYCKIGELSKLRGEHLCSLWVPEGGDEEGKTERMKELEEASGMKDVPFIWLFIPLLPHLLQCLSQAKDLL